MGCCLRGTHRRHSVGGSQRNGLCVRGMAVLPAARGLGVGRRLLAQVEAFAVENGCVRLFLSTTPFLTRAIRLYEDFGFRVTNDGPHDLFGTSLFSMEKMLTAGTFSRS
jgi:GNAT superfamily N-acetyltransferase